MAVAPHVSRFDGAARRIDSASSASFVQTDAVGRVRLFDARVHHPGGRLLGQGRLAGRHRTGIGIVIVYGRGPLQRDVDVVGLLVG